MSSPHQHIAWQTAWGTNLTEVADKISAGSVLAFGVDTSLPAGPGWGQATGLGTPNGWNFVQSVAEDHDD